MWLWCNYNEGTNKWGNEFVKRGHDIYRYWFYYSVGYPSSESFCQFKNAIKLFYFPIWLSSCNKKLYDFNVNWKRLLHLGRFGSGQRNRAVISPRRQNPCFPFDTLRTLNGAGCRSMTPSPLSKMRDHSAGTQDLQMKAFFFRIFCQTGLLALSFLYCSQNFDKQKFPKESRENRSTKNNLKDRNVMP